MAKTLFIVNDATLQSLGDGIVGKMLDEVKSIYAFVAAFKVSLTVPANVPAAIDFSDSIVKLVAGNEDVAPMENQADQQELRSVRAGIKQANLAIRMPDSNRSATNPDQGGVGWRSKSVVAVGGTKAAIVQTGGVVSIEYAADAVLNFTAPNKWPMDEAKSNYDTKLKNAKLAHGDDQAKKIKDAEASFEKSKAHWKLKTVAPKNWPQDMQALMSVAVGRLVAHEARHQYVGSQHFDDGGLGGESVEILGVKRSERFLEDDQKQIAAQISTFERIQRDARIHIETFPRGQPFAFHEG